MASSIVLPTRAQLGNYAPTIADQLLTIAAAAKADIDSSAVSGAMRAPVANVAALTALVVTAITTGTLCLVESDNTGRPSIWMYSSTSTATDATKQLVAAPDAGAGAWLLQSASVVLKLAVGFATADAAAIFTLPAGSRLFVRRAYWEVVTGFTGGAASAIGISSDNTAYSTKGDVLGGAAGDVAATLISTTPGPFVGTAGAKSALPIVLSPTNIVRFDRITSAFTAGAGYVHVVADVLTNAGV